MFNILVIKSSIPNVSHMIRILYYRMNFSYSDFRFRPMTLILNNEWTQFCAVMLCIRCHTSIQWYEANRAIHVTCNLYLATVRSKIIDIHVVCYCCENDIFDRYDVADGITDDVTGIPYHHIINYVTSSILNDLFHMTFHVNYIYIYLSRWCMMINHGGTCYNIRWPLWYLR